MNITRWLSAFVALAMSSCASAPIALDVPWTGIYRVTSATAFDDAKSPTGKRNIAGGMQAVEPTTNIPAILGIRFGVSYSVRDVEISKPVDIEIIWRYPEGGITNSRTGVTSSTDRFTQRCNIGSTCTAGYYFREPWELKTGKWTLELWYESRQLLMQQFNVFEP